MRRRSRYLLYSGNIAVNGHGIVRVIDHKTGFCPAGFFHVLFLDIVDLHLFLIPAFGVIGSKARRLLESAVGKLLRIVELYHNVGAGDFFGMEPPVIPRGKFKGQIVVLEIVCLLNTSPSQRDGHQSRMPSSA